MSRYNEYNKTPPKIDSAFVEAVQNYEFLELTLQFKNKRFVIEYKDKEAFVKELDALIKKYRI